MKADDGDGLDIELQAAPAPQAADSVAAVEGSAVGAPTGSPVVVLDRAVQVWMEAYARTDTTRERGGILLGRLSQAGDEARVTVEAAIEAAGAEERRATLTFTHETWAHVNAVKDERYPKLRIVGWFHTHPAYGIFLSGYDLFIHRNFFNLPWQLAFVLDPVAGDSGFFGWRGEDVSRLPGYYLAGVGAPLPAPAAAAAPPPPAVLAPRRRARLWPAAAAAAFVVALLLLFPRHRPAPPPLPPPPKPPAPVQEKLPPTQEKKVSKPPAKPVQSYVQMQRGDTLWDLASKNLGNPLRYRELQDLNRISDPRRIAAGTILAIPADGGSAAKPLRKGEADDGKGQRDGHRRHREQGAAGHPPR